MYEEFKHGEEVVILKGNRDIKDNKGRQYTGSKGIVVDYDEQYREVLVKITDLTIEIPEKILRTINSNNNLI
jgi:ribosomal protein L21E